jgi:hypothetical protein
MVYIICTIIYVYTKHINMAYSEFPFPFKKKQSVDVVGKN